MRVTLWERARSAPDQAPPHSRARKRLGGMSSQKAQSLFIELGHAFVESGMRAAFKNQKLTSRDSTLERVGEAQRGNGVVATESDLGRGLDACQLGESIVGDHRARLAHEGIKRLLWSAAHESCELVDVFWLGRIKLGREAVREYPLDDHFLDAVQGLCNTQPAFDHNLEEWIGFRPATLQRQRFDPVRIFAGKP